MKYVLVLTVVLLVSCGSARFYESKFKIITTSNNPEYLNIAPDNGIGEPVGNLDNVIGDTIQAYGYSRNVITGGLYYKIMHSGQYYWVGKNSAIDEYTNGIQYQATTFKAAKDQASIIWGRAMKYINMKSNMKIQNQSDTFIQTYNPTESNKYGFRINKYDLGNDEIEIQVECMGKSLFEPLQANWLAKECAYFMRTGNLALIQ